MSLDRFVLLHSQPPARAKLRSGLTDVGHSQVRAFVTLSDACAALALNQRWGVVLTPSGITGIMNAMAKNISIIVNDDLDGSANAETVTFGFDGTTYEIDLSEKNRAKLAKAVAPYIEAGRRVTRSRTTARRSAGPRIDRAVVRTWAKDKGFRVSERGRISAEVMQQYEAAH